MFPEPLVRLGIAHAFLETVRASEPNLLKQLAAARANAALAAETEPAALEGWVFLRRHRHLNDGMLQVIGLQAFRSLWRQTMLRLSDEQTLKPLIDGAIALFGRTPQALTKIVPRAWALAFREAGNVVVEPSDIPNQAFLRLVGFPPDVFEGGFIEGIAGCLEAFYDLCDASGDVSIAPAPSAVADVVYVLRWR